MKLEDAKTAIAKITQLKVKNRRRELAFLRRGPRPENALNCLGLVSQFVYPKSVDDLSACAEVLSSFVAGDCETGQLGFGRAMSLLVADSPSADLRVSRVLGAQNIVELQAQLRPILTLMRSKGITPDYAQLLADVANYSAEAWRGNIVARWSLGYYRGMRAEKGQVNEAEPIEEAA